MKYTFTVQPARGESWVETEDGKVVRASHAFGWTRGMLIAQVLKWLDARSIKWKVQE